MICLAEPLLHRSRQPRRRFGSDTRVAPGHIRRTILHRLGQTRAGVPTIPGRFGLSPAQRMSVRMASSASKREGRVPWLSRRSWLCLDRPLNGNNFRHTLSPRYTPRLMVRRDVRLTELAGRRASHPAAAGPPSRREPQYFADVRLLHTIAFEASCGLDAPKKYGSITDL